MSLLPNTNDGPTIHIPPPCCDRTICPRYSTHLLCRESPITGGNIYNIGHKIPVHWILHLNTVYHFQRVDALMCGYIFYAYLRKYTKGVMSNYIPEDYMKKQNLSFIGLWHVQDTEVVCHKKSPFHCLVQFVFIYLHKCNEVM